MKNAKTVLKAPDLEELVERILLKAGFDRDDARIICEVLVWADLRGHGSHGVARLKKYLDFIKRGDLDPQARPTIERDLGALVHIDAHRSAGPVAMSAATAVAVAAARRSGAAWVLVGHTTHTGPIGFFMNHIAQAGMIGIAFAAGTPLMAYHGAASPAVSTSPLAIGIPTAGRFPFLLDMATSVAANGKIQQALRNNHPIPEGWALDKYGRATTDPSKAAYMLPIGGPKGAGLSLAFEMICSLGASAPILQSALIGPTPHVQNAAVCAIDIGRLRDIDQFRAEVSDLAGLIKLQPRMAGVDEILLPGERSERTAIERRINGIPLQDELVRELRQLAL